MGLTILSLAKMGVSRAAGSLSQTLELAVELSIRQNGSRLTLTDLVQCLAGMGRMGMRWEDLSRVTRDVLAYALYMQVRLLTSCCNPQMMF